MKNQKDKIVSDYLKVLMKLNGDRFSCVTAIKTHVAETPDTPEDILDFLANDSDNDVKWRVAGNPNTSITTLTKLSTSKHWYVLNNVGLNLKRKEHTNDEE
jgi:hypothetical protein